jgi:hypothetical protein
MSPKARRALDAIRRCVADQRYVLTLHFVRRMEERHLFWGDVLAVLARPRQVRQQPDDAYGRTGWLLEGRAATGEDVHVVCAIETDESLTEFITLYWAD